MKEIQRRSSKQRQLILGAVKASRRHPTAEEIYLAVKQQNPGLSLGTVYRNLNLLAEQGEIMNLNQGSGSDHFDGDCDDHSHVVCNRCKNVFDLDYDISPITQEIAQQASPLAEVQQVRIMAFGLCAECQKKESQENEIK